MTDRNTPLQGHAATGLGRIRYVETGSGDRVLMLLPQSGRSWAMFAGLLPLLAPRFRTVAIDYPGSGESDPLPAGAGIEDLAGAMVAVLDTLGAERAHVYGLHVGNKIAAAMAAGWPSRVDHVVLAGQSHSLVPSAQRRVRTVGKTRRRLLETQGPAEEALVQWSDTFSRLSGIWWSDGVLRGIADPAPRLLAARRAVDEIQSMQGVPGYYRANYRFDLEAAASRIAAPTLVLEIATPTEDATIGRQGDALAAIISDARCVVIEAADEHGITLDDRPDELAAILLGYLPATDDSARLPGRAGPA